ncbi:6524_t:CDS:2, partial [Ambispora gerdemannii]
EIKTQSVQVDSIRYVVKKTRLNTEIWLSAPATTTETDKGIYVRKHGTDDLPTSTDTRRIVEGKFKSPSNADVPEKILQEYFINECNALRALNLCRTRGVIWRKVLQLQPRRAYVMLTDCRVISIFKGFPAIGWRYLVTIMECSPDKLGWMEPSLNFGLDTVTLVRPINTGRTSVVYEGKLNDKMFVGGKNVLKALSSLKSPHLQTLLLDGEGILVTTPLCTKVNNLRKEDIGNIINTLKVVHSKFNLVHMDLRKYNFLRNDKGDILIIDWGYNAVIGETVNFACVLECMPDDILASLANGGRTTYSAKIDLICLARAFYLMLHKPPNAERISFGGNPDISSRAQNILAFWGSNAKSELWDRIFQDAKGLKYEGVIEELEKFF